MSLDLINGLFEFGGALVILKSCYLCFKEKMVHGVSVLATSWFLAWSIYNLFFYPSLGQNFSFIAACLVVFSQTLYVWLLVYYRWIYGKVYIDSDQPISRLVGKWHKWNDIDVLPIFHPSYLLRGNDQAKKDTYQHLLLLKSKLEKLNEHC